MNNVLEPFRSTFVCTNAEDLQLSIKENVLWYENSESSQNKNFQYKNGILFIQDGDNDTVTLNNVQGYENTKGNKGEFESTNNLIQPICAPSNIEEKSKIKTDNKTASCTLLATKSEESEIHVMKKLKISLKKSETVSPPENKLSKFLSSSVQKKRKYLINDRKNVSCENEQCVEVFQTVDDKQEE